MEALFIMAAALVGMGGYCHYLLTVIGHMKDQNGSLSEMIKSMAHELKELGSPNVYIQTKEGADPPF